MLHDDTLVSGQNSEVKATSNHRFLPQNQSVTTSCCQRNNVTSAWCHNVVFGGGFPPVGQLTSSWEDHKNWGIPHPQLRNSISKLNSDFRNDFGWGWGKHLRRYTMKIQATTREWIFPCSCFAVINRPLPFSVTFNQMRCRQAQKGIHLSNIFSITWTNVQNEDLK